MPVISRDLIIPADDAFPLAATLFDSGQRRPGAAESLIVVGAATAVARRYYAPFARFLAQHGPRVLTFDYRGIGGSRPDSLRGFPARMRDWGVLDTPGVLRWVSESFPGLPIRWVGHSYGGFAPGLAHNNGLVDRLLAVSSMTADWRLMPAPERYRIALLMGAVLPAAARLIGYFPGRLNGSEDLPKGVLLEWARWCMTRSFLFGDDTLPERRHFAGLRAAVRFTLIEDDKWISAPSVEHLASQYTSATETTFWPIRPADVNLRSIGHVGFFRSECASTLWESARVWLENPAG